MEKEFIPYEQALALKELGFDELCFTIYLNGNNAKGLLESYNNLRINSEIKSFYKYRNKHCSAPLYQQVFIWFEEKYGLFVDRQLIFTDNELISAKYYIKSIHGTWDVEFLEPYSEFDALKAKTACINKLIEIIKTQKENG